MKNTRLVKYTDSSQRGDKIAMRVLICDDNKEDISSLVENLNFFFEKNSLQYTYEIIIEIEEILSKVNSFDLIFLDIEIDTKNGIKIGKEIRKFNKDIPIILTTNFKKYALDGYKINANCYFLKPINKFEMCVELQEVISEYLFNKKNFFDPKIYRKKIYFKDILYIEFQNRKSHIHLQNGQIISSYIGLNDWKEKTCDLYFSQSHRSFLVNLNNISGFSKNNIIMMNNELVPISRHYKLNFENEYLSFIQKGGY